MRPAYLLFALSLLMCACASGGDAEVAHVNAIVGDISFEAAFGRSPTASDEDWTRIATHLRFVEAELRGRDVSHLGASARHARARNLQRLHGYWAEGVFPRNQRRATRVPRFVEAAGPDLASPRRVCAVGALAEADLGAEAIDRIGARFTFDEIDQIREPAFVAWAAASGLSLDELAMIQPTYRFEDEGTPRQQHDRHIQEQLASRRASVNDCVHAALTARQRHPATLLARVEVDVRGTVTRASLTGTDDPRIRSCAEKVLSATLIRSFPARSSAERSFDITGPHLADGTLDERYPFVVAGRADPAIQRCGLLMPVTPGGVVFVLVKASFDPFGTVRATQTSIDPFFKIMMPPRVSECVRAAINALEGPLFSGEGRRFEFDFMYSMKTPHL